MIAAKLLLLLPITAERRQESVIRLVLAMVQCYTRVVIASPVLIRLLMVILTQLMIVPAMMKLAALLIIVMAVVLGIPARHV